MLLLVVVVVFSYNGPIHYYDRKTIKTENKATENLVKSFSHLYRWLHTCEVYE